MRGEEGTADGWPVDVFVDEEGQTPLRPGALLEVQCPRCRKRLQRGFVTAGKGLKFRDNGRMRLTLFGGIPIISMWMSRGTPAWRCQECQLVVIDPVAS